VTEESERPSRVREEELNTNLSYRLVGEHGEHFVKWRTAHVHVERGDPNVPPLGNLRWYLWPVDSGPVNKGKVFSELADGITRWNG
jgi:hypothetical protein